MWWTGLVTLMIPMNPTTLRFWRAKKNPRISWLIRQGFRRYGSVMWWGVRRGKVICCPWEKNPLSPCISVAQLTNNSFLVPPFIALSPSSLRLPRTLPNVLIMPTNPRGFGSEPVSCAYARTLTAAAPDTVRWQAASALHH